MSILPAITVSESAAQQIHKLLAQRGGGVGLRLSLKTTGCNGWSYVIDFADDIASDDIIFDSQGVKVVVKESGLAMLAGTYVDYVQEGINYLFKFKNPNSKSECGCGESFSIDK